MSPSERAATTHIKPRGKPKLVALGARCYSAGTRLTWMLSMKTSRFCTQNLRIGRVSLPHQIYMITTVTHQRKPVFQDLYTGRCLVNSLRKANVSAQTLAYVVMPDHLHWLMQLKDNFSLPQAIQFVKTDSAKAINQLNHSSGKVWSKGYYDQALRYEDQIKGLARYIVANPVRAELVSSVREYSLWDAIWL